MPTNQEWLHKLANESPDELKAWFDAEHNDTFNAKNDVSGDSAHSNDENAHLKAHSKTEPMLSEQSALLSEELDSREKLEADAIQLAQNIWHQGQNYANGVREVRHIAWQERDVIELLDRQAAITANENKELIEWQAATVARLQKEADTIKAANDDYRDEVGRLQRRNDELRTSYDKLKRERDNLADDLLACNREREQLRKHLGIALDHAHDICSLVDIDGNVLDVGD